MVELNDLKMDPKVYEQLNETQEILSNLKSLIERDITEESLGAEHGFHSANKIKNNVLNYAEKLIYDAINTEIEVNESIFSDALIRINKSIDTFKREINHIDDVAKSGVHRENFPNMRKAIISRIVSEKESLFRDLSTLELSIRSSKLQSHIDNIDYFEEAKTNTDEAVGSIEINAKKIEKILTNLQDKTSKEAIDNSAAQFGSLLSHHKMYEHCWLGATILCAISLFATVHYAFSYDLTSFENGDPIVNALGLLKRVFLISLPAVFLRMTLAKYNTERGLRIVYGHRETVLNQYKHFEAGIGDDTEAKNQFRLEIAKYIFSDPRTNYNHSELNSGSININPVVTALDRIVDKK